jgi:Right handed beta helix region
MIRTALLSGILTFGTIIAGNSLAFALEDSGALETSGPIVADHDGQVIEGLRIQATNRPAIVVNGFSNVVIRNVQVRHEGAHGIACIHAPGLIIENVDIEHTGAHTGSFQENNIDCLSSDGLSVRNARLRGGSSGVWVTESNHVRLSYIEGYNFRGPFPRGQLAQFDNSPNCILEDFSAINDPDVAWTEDIVSVYFSDGCVVRRGLLVGNNSPSGVGVMFEDSRNGLVEDVDTVAQGNGSFSAYPGHRVTFRRTRARDNICGSQAGRGRPLSNGLVWAGSTNSSELRVEASQYFNLCNPEHLVWDRNSFASVQIAQADFSPRSPIKLSFAWDNGS